MRQGLVALGVVVGLAGLTVSNAGAADRQKVWQGFLSITNRTAQCSGVPGTTGTHVSIFRPKLADANTNTFLSILYVRAAITLLNTSEATVPQMQGAGNYKGTVIGNKAKVFNYNATYNFTVTPATVAGNTKIVTVSGTINNIFKHNGCNVTFDAKYAKRD